MNRTLQIFIALIVVLLIFLGVSWFVQSSNPDLTLDNPLLRFAFVIIGLLIAFAIYWFTRDRNIWNVGTREVVYMSIGAALYAIFSYLFNGSVFVVPSVSQVALRPAVVIPMFFGYTFGPVVGFFTGAVGNMFGDALTGFGLSPQWSIGNGLIGFVAGLAMLFGDKKRSLNTVLGIGAALVVLVTALFLLNRGVSNQTYYDPVTDTFGETQLSLLAGVSLLVGLILVAVVRFASGSNIDVAAAITWGMLGNIIGLGFAAVSDIWINGFTPVVALVGEFIPSAGPNLIFAAILLPLLVLAYASVRRQSGR
jgi:uncharacterized membrane protein